MLVEFFISIAIIILAFVLTALFLGNKRTETLATILLCGAIILQFVLTGSVWRKILISIRGIALGLLLGNLPKVKAFVKKRISK